VSRVLADFNVDMLDWNRMIEMLGVMRRPIHKVLGGVSRLGEMSNGRMRSCEICI